MRQAQSAAIADREPTPDALERIARDLAADADNHGKLARQHRDLRRRNIEALRELRAFMEAAGLPVDRIPTGRRRDA